MDDEYDERGRGLPPSGDPGHSADPRAAGVPRHYGTPDAARIGLDRNTPEGAEIAFFSTPKKVSSCRKLFSSIVRAHGRMN